MLWRRLNGVTLIGLLVSILGVWFAYDGSFITKGGMVPVMQQTRDGWEETGEERWATAVERRREGYALGALLLITGAIFAYCGLKNAGETKWDYPDRFGPWLVDKFHRILAGVIFFIPAALILPAAFPFVEELPGILQAAAVLTILVPFWIGGFLATWYWQRFAPDKPKSSSG
jgi:hypothetical protein